MVVEQHAVCPICAKPWGNTHSRWDHTLQGAGSVSEGLAFLVDVEGVCTDSARVALSLAKARAELRRYFPGKEFEILPHHSRVFQEQGHSHMYVSRYVVIEK